MCQRPRPEAVDRSRTRWVSEWVIGRARPPVGRKSGSRISLVFPKQKIAVVIFVKQRNDINVITICVQCMREVNTKK